MKLKAIIMTAIKRLLIVDDNPATRYAIRRVVERHGYEGVEADTGKSGLETIKSGEFAGVILDVNLPDMSGFDVVRQLRSDPRTALLPVVHVTAASIKSLDVVTGLNAGADAYLIHPVDPEVLLATLRTLIRVRDAEEALRKTEKNFRSIFETISTPVAILNRELDVIEGNPAFSSLFESEGNTTDLRECFTPAAAMEVSRLQDAIGRAEPWIGVIGMKLPDGLRETEWRATPHQQPGCSVVVIEDITDQRVRERLQRRKLHSTQSKLAEEIAARAETEVQLLQAQKMDALGKLTGGIAHDFNNLLTSIIGAIEMMTRQAQTGQKDRMLNMADSALGAARRAASLTRRMLAFARQQPLDAKNVDINERVLSLKELLGRTIGETHTLHIELCNTPVLTALDPTQFDNALINLVVNARDAMPNGGSIRIETARKHLSGDHELMDGEYASLSVIDAGVGISPEVLERVFEPFFTTKEPGKGTGLGLSMIYGFTRQSGGVTRIHTEKGAGTEVMLLFPLADGVEHEVASSQVTGRGGNGEQILLVEDTAEVREVTEEVLREAGYAVTAVGCARDALTLIRGNESIDLLLTDIGLPDMSGRKLVEIARSWRPSLPILFMTGYEEDPSAARQFTELGTALIQKPFEVTHLLNQIHKQLS
jgi:CheY-like chemotaxis protein